MKPHEFLAQLDEARLVAAIQAAERKSSGEIRVYISHRQHENVLDEARRRFHKLGMGRTRQRNGVLIYFAPRSRQFAIWGDQGVHEKCGEDFWRDIAGAMTPLLKEGQFTAAIARAIERAGEALARHFPRAPDDTNELPDRIEQG